MASPQMVGVRKPVVAIKVRPLPGVERGLYEFYHDDHKVTVNEESYNGFDHVFGHKHASKAVDAEKQLHYKCVEPMLKRLFHGENCTILAYGQTGSGKTFTTKHLSHYLATSIFERSSADNLKMKAKFVEVYMDKFKDLMFPENTRVDIYETGPNSYSFTAKEVTVESAEHLLAILADAEKERKTSRTHMNAGSSRSHVCLMLTIEQPWNGAGIRDSCNMDIKPRLPPTPFRTPTKGPRPLQSQASDSSGSEGSPQCVVQSTLYLVDLAGSERVGETGAVGEAAKEGASINNSLMHLRTIISELRAGKRPTQGVYRRSKMTRLLQDSMGGNSNVLFIGCVTPSRFCDADTKSTLQYAMKIAGITSTVAVNKCRMPATLHTGEFIHALQMEVAALKAQLEALEAELEDARQKHAAALERIKRLETTVLVQRSEHEELDRKMQQEVAAGRKTVADADAVREQMRAEQQASLDALHQEQEHMQQQLHRYNAAERELEADRSGLQARVRQLEQAEAAAVAMGQSARQQVQQLEESVEESRRREAELEQQLQQVVGQLEGARAETQEVREERGRKEADLEQQLQQVVVQLEGARAEVEKVREEKGHKEVELEVQLQGLKRELEEAREKGETEAKAAQQEREEMERQHEVQLKEVRGEAEKQAQAAQQEREELTRQHEVQLKEVRGEAEKQAQAARQQREDLERQQQDTKEAKEAELLEQLKGAQQQVQQAQQQAQEQAQEHAAAVQGLRTQLEAAEQQRQSAADAAAAELHDVKAAHAAEAQSALTAHASELEAVKAAAQQAAEVQQQQRVAEQEQNARTSAAAEEKLRGVQGQLEAAKAEQNRLEAALQASTQQAGSAASSLQQQLEQAQVDAQQQQQSSRAELSSLQQQLKQAQVDAQQQQQSSRAELSSLQQQLEQAQQQHAAALQEQQTKAAAASKNWESVRRAALRVAVVAQEATAAMSTRASHVIHAHKSSCMHRIAAELSQLQDSWQQLHDTAAAPDQQRQTSALLHHLQRAHAQQHALRLEVARLQHAVLGQEVELGALRGAVGAGTVKRAAEIGAMARSGEVEGEVGGADLQDVERKVGEVQQVEAAEKDMDVKGQEDQGVQQQQLLQEDAEEGCGSAAVSVAEREGSGSQWGDGCFEGEDEAQEGCCGQGAAGGGGEGCTAEPTGEEVGGGSDAGHKEEGENGDLSNAQAGEQGDDGDDVAQHDQQPSPVSAEKAKQGGHPTQADLSLVRLAIRPSTKASDDEYVLLDAQLGNCLLSSSNPAKDAGPSTSWRYSVAGQHGHVPTGKMEGVLGDAHGNWLSLPTHGLLGLPQPFFVRASGSQSPTAKSGRSSNKRPQRSRAATCDATKACFVALSGVPQEEVEKGTALELYHKPARHAFEKLSMGQAYRHQCSQLDVALAYPIPNSPGSYALTSLNTNHLEPGSVIDLRVDGKLCVEVQPRALLQHLLVQEACGEPQEAPLPLQAPISACKVQHGDPTHATAKAADVAPGFWSTTSGLKPHAHFKRQAKISGSPVKRTPTKAIPYGA